MNNPLLYPFLAIVLIFTLAFGVWCYFAIKSARERKRRAWRLWEGIKADEYFQRSLAEWNELNARRGRICDPPMYRHRGHIHAAAKRGPNRADRRVGMVYEPGDGYFDGGVTGGKS